MGRSTKKERARDRGTAGLQDRRRALGRLRADYFAHAWDSAGRYGIDFDEVIVHLWRVRRRRGRLHLGAVRHVDDLVHAVACTGGSGAAWADLFDRYEGLLVRRCAQRVNEMDAILAVRSLFADLRRHRRESLLTYGGERPLRAWLTDRVITRLGRGHSVWCVPHPRSTHGLLHRSSTEMPAEAPVTLPFEA